jgi:undecaprenyl-diphosphatase
MLIVQSVILGLLQGLTEFIPISSSAHLVIVPWLFGWTDPAVQSLAFDVALHLGTLVAVVAFFRKDWIRLASAWFRSVAERKIGADQDRRLAWYLLLACIPGGVAGVLLEGRISSIFHVNPIPRAAMIAMALAIALLGAILWLVDRTARPEKTVDDMKLRDALLIGLAQALAIFPGVSRSGATITAGIALKLTRESAARFSFLLSTPIIAGAALKAGVGLLRAGLPPEMRVPLLVGISVSAVVGYLAIAALIRYLERRSFQIFIVYRVALGVLVLALGWGMRHPLG